MNTSFEYGDATIELQQQRQRIVHVKDFFKNPFIKRKQVVDGTGISDVDLQFSLLLRHCSNHIYDFSLYKIAELCLNAFVFLTFNVLNSVGMS